MPYFEKAELDQVTKMQNLFEINPSLRTSTEWQELLAALVVSLSEFTGIEFNPVSWYINDDVIGHASSSNCVNIRGSIQPNIGLELCGVICASINFTRSVGVSADLLLYWDGQRQIKPPNKDLISFLYLPTGWINQGWIADGYGGWESHLTNRRWLES